MTESACVTDADANPLATPASEAAPTPSAEPPMTPDDTKPLVTADGEDAAAEDAEVDILEGILDGDAAAAFTDGDVPNIYQEVFDEHRSKAAVSGKETTQTYSHTVKVR
jgi:hypothetical protein